MALAAIEAVYAAAGAPDLWPAALDAIAACFDGVGTVMIVYQEDGTAATIVSPALVAAQRDYEAGSWKLDFMAMRLIERASLLDRRCLMEADLASPEEVTTHPFYTTFRKQYGLGGFLVTVVLPSPSLPVILSMQAKAGRSLFSDEDAALFERIAHHVERSLALTVQLLDSERIKTGLADALSQVSCGVFVLNLERRVIFCNAEARRLVGSGLRLDSEYLSIAGPKHAAFLEAFGDCASGAIVERDNPLLVVDGEDGRRIVLQLLPFSSQSVAEEAMSESRVLVLAAEHSAANPINPALVRDLLGLTLAEARLASLVGAGQAPREAASALNITEETARSVLKRIFSKTGVSRQAELAALLSSVVTR